MRGVRASASPTPHPAFGHPLPAGEGSRSGGCGSLMPERLFADPASGPALASRGSRVSRRFLQQLPPAHGGPRHWRFGPPPAQGPRARLAENEERKGDIAIQRTQRGHCYSKNAKGTLLFTVDVYRNAKGTLLFMNAKGTLLFTVDV